MKYTPINKLSNTDLLNLVIYLHFNANVYHNEIQHFDFQEAKAELEKRLNVDQGEGVVKKLQEIMVQLGDVHQMLAKTSLPAKEYNTVSHLFVKAKVDLFNLYLEFKRG